VRGNEVIFFTGRTGVRYFAESIGMGFDAVGGRG